MSGDLVNQAFIVFGSIVGILIGVLLLFLFLGWKRQVVHGNRSPYTQAIMQFGVDIARSLQKQVNSFLEEFPEEDNPQIDFTKAALCPVTGRIFTKCVTRGVKIDLDWSFLHKRFPGTKEMPSSFVSWGALSEEERGELRVIHPSLEGFQIEQSSPYPRPERIDREFALLSPGPLYVEKATHILVGWKRVPGTSFEVLIVQRPLFQSLDETL